MSLDIDVSGDSGESQRFSLTGRLDTETAPLLQTELDESLDPGTQSVILDMKQLEFVSSAGLRVIFRAKKTMDKRNGKLLVVNMQPQVRKVFDIVKAAGSMSIFKDDEEMDEYLSAIQKQVLDGD